MSDLLRDASTEKRWFTILPNIIFEQGLTRAEFYLYAAYKRIAGEGGECYYSSKRLAALLECSTATMRRARQSLVDKGLVEVATKRVQSGQEVICVTIVDIWNENALRFIESTEGGRQEPPFVKGGRQEPPRGSLMSQKGAARNPKEEPIKKTQKEEQMMNAAAIFSTALDNFLIKPSEIGKQMVADALDEYGPERVMAAMKEAVAHNARSWRYVEKVLDGKGRSRDGGPVMDDDWREANEEKIDEMLAAP